MPRGAVLFEFDVKLGPVFKFAVPPDIEVSHEETMVLFATRTCTEEGFSGITINNRTWATYFRPPFLFAILLSPGEQPASFEHPMRDVLGAYELQGEITPEELSRLYSQVVRRTGESLHRELLKSLPVKRILEALSSSEEPLRPVWSPKTGYRYPAAEAATGLSSRKTNRLLASMVTAGILRAKVCRNIAVCPHCQGHRLILHGVCPRCGSTALEEGEALEHFVCNHTDFLEAFSTPSGLVCPNCRTPLTNDTYRTLGVTYRCVKCGTFSQRRKMMLYCLDCKETFPPSKASHLPLYCLWEAEEGLQKEEGSQESQSEEEPAVKSRVPGTDKA